MQWIPQHPIVDTGPLFDFLLWRFSVSFGMPTLLSKLRYLRESFYKDSVQWYFSKAKPITTCPQVIAEIHHHAQELGGRILGNFWRFGQKELIELGLSEEMVKLEQMEGDTLSSFGPTDTALLHIAYLSSDPGQPIFTEDTRLAGECRKKQLKVLSIAEVLSIWQQYGTK